MKSEVVQALLDSCAKSTWNTRKRVDKLTKNAKTTDEALRALLALQVGTATKAKYISAYKWLQTRNRTTLIADVANGMRRTTKSEKLKALPLTKSMLLRLLGKPTISNGTKMVMAKAFATASRVDEVLRVDALTTKNGLTVFTRSKTNPTAASRIDHLWFDETPDKWVSKFDRMSSRQRRQLSLSSIRRELKSIPIPVSYLRRFQILDPRNTIRKHLTFHSAKRGAAMYLWEAAAKQQLRPDQVARALKHKSVESSLQYAPNPTAVAKAYRTDDVAKLLHLKPSATNRTTSQ